MPTPGIGTVHTNQPLSSLLVGYQNSEYVLGNVFARVPVNFDTGLYYKWDKGSKFRDEAEVIGIRGRTPRISFTASSETYSCKEYGLAMEIPVRLRENMDPAIAAEADAAEIVMDKILLKLERIIAAMLTTTANWTAGNVTIGAGLEWDTATGGKPIDDVDNRRKVIRAATGLIANTLVIPWLAAMALRKNTGLMQYVNGGVTPQNPAIIELSTLQKLFDVPNVIVVGGMYDSATEGATSTLAEIMGDSAWLGYVAPAAGIMKPSAGYTFMRKTPQVKTWQENDPEQDVVKVLVNFDPKVTMADAGCVIGNLLA